jgi:hypothetical protein
MKRAPLVEALKALLAWDESQRETLTAFHGSNVPITNEDVDRFVVSQREARGRWETWLGWLGWSEKELHEEIRGLLKRRSK